MKISILHPSRSRPSRAYETAKKWIEKAGCETEYILSLDEDDLLGGDYFEKYSFAANDWPGFKCILSKNRSAVDAINNAAKVSTGYILIVLSDDFDCPDNWGAQIIEATQGKTDWILKTPDGIQDWMITMPILDRAYYNRFGYIYYPEFRHMFCDTFLTCVADLTGRKIEANIPFKHNHYSVAGGKDEVNARADATWTQGENLFLELARKNYLLSPDQIKGQIKSQDYLNWIKNRI